MVLRGSNGEVSQVVWRGGGGGELEAYLEGLSFLLCRCC